MCAINNLLGFFCDKGAPQTIEFWYMVYAFAGHTRIRTKVQETLTSALAYDCNSLVPVHIPPKIKLNLDIKGTQGVLLACILTRDLE